MVARRRVSLKRDVGLAHIRKMPQFVQVTNPLTSATHGCPEGSVEGSARSSPAPLASCAFAGLRW
jgi:hypothetical protein